MMRTTYGAIQELLGSPVSKKPSLEAGETDEPAHR